MKWADAVALRLYRNWFIVSPDWSGSAHATFVPALPAHARGWAMLVSIVWEQTMQPHNTFFWQASQEVEEAKSAARKRMPTGCQRDRVFDRD